MTDEGKTGALTAFKVWAGTGVSFGISGWSDLAAFLACISAVLASVYSIILITEWWRRRRARRRWDRD